VYAAVQDTLWLLLLLAALYHACASAVLSQVGAALTPTAAAPASASPAAADDDYGSLPPFCSCWCAQMQQVLSVCNANCHCQTPGGHQQ
jgi:hypothetical protein